MPNAALVDVVDEVPTEKLHVVYYPDLVVQHGNVLTPTQVQEAPQVSWSGGEDNAVLHTLLMVDPDAPSRKDPKFKEVLHWAVINVPKCDLSAAQTVAEYVGSGPPEGTGLHRYIFLLFHQKGEIQEELFIDKFTRQKRLNFNTREFATKHELGAPIAGNYYQAEYDDYVPIRNQQFTA